MSQSRNILIGITGSISAYKVPLLVRQLIQAGHSVKVITTDSALQFVTKPALSTVSKNPVYSSFYAGENGEWVNHVELGLWADIMLIAPASANTLAKMATGMSDNLLLATYLSAKCPVMAAPAMDHDMWNHKATQRNIEQLKVDGIHIIQPEQGELASGLFGDGRLPEPETLFLHITQFLKQ